MHTIMLWDPIQQLRYSTWTLSHFAFADPMVIPFKNKLVKLFLNQWSEAISYCIPIGNADTIIFSI